MTPEELAIRAGATKLGEDGPDGAHWIFSQRALASFVALVQEPPSPKIPPLPYQL